MFVEKIKLNKYLNNKLYHDSPKPGYLEYSCQCLIHFPIKHNLFYLLFKYPRALQSIRGLIKQTKWRHHILLLTAETKTSVYWSFVSLELKSEQCVCVFLNTLTFADI